MSKFLRFAVIPAVLGLFPLPVLAQAVLQYGFPITETPSGDLPCHMVSRDGHTLDLAQLCGGTLQTAASTSQRSASQARIARRRLGSSNYLAQYQRLAETYPDSKVVDMLPSMPRIPYAESVCNRLNEGMTLEQIRTSDIQQLQPSGNLTLDNARKQNIEITLKLAPQYYCPESSPAEGMGNSGNPVNRFNPTNNRSIPTRIPSSTDAFSNGSSTFSDPSNSNRFSDSNNSSRFNGSSTFNGSGICNSPFDRASDGSLCGGRASNRQQGGR